MSIYSGCDRVGPVPGNSPGRKFDYDFSFLQGSGWGIYSSKLTSSFTCKSPTSEVANRFYVLLPQSKNLYNLFLAQVYACELLKRFPL